MFKGLRFQKRITLLPGVRINLSKSGVSTSLGPHGADVNIGRDGVTTNAGIPGTGLSYRRKVGGGKTWLAILALVGGLGVWAFQHSGQVKRMMAGATAPATAQAGASAAPMTPVNTTGQAVRYVHRAGSVIRSEAKASSQTLKKEVKGAQVILLSEGDGWSQVRDGDVTGYMRSSVLGAAPPR